MAGADVLGIRVSEELLEKWLGWFAPDPQPFLVSGAGRSDPEVPAELRDTYELYSLAERGLSVRWMSEAEYTELDRRERSALIRSQVRLGRGLVPTVEGSGSDAGPAARTQADGFRFLWWPSLLTRGNRGRVIRRFVAGSRSPSRHGEVPPDVWTGAARVLPGARSIAATFPPGSGPNCFGAVMAAAGSEGAEKLWMQREPFEEWLARATTATSSRERAAPGVVLVWRDGAGEPQHAAVTLGSGWALHKPSQGWMSPTLVLRVDELIRGVRRRGLRLSRYRIVP